MLAWFAWRMPETLRPEDWLSLSACCILAGWRTTLTERKSLEYTLASTALLGALYGYLNSIQQIMAEAFGRPELLIVIFATTAATMAGANLFNAQLSSRRARGGSRHAVVVMLIVASLIHLAIDLADRETLLTFAVLQVLTLGCFGLASSNFSTMAMEEMGHIAGVASSVQGFIGILIAATVGALIGRRSTGRRCR
ncbi:hypothetical protein AB5I41_03695 [Sphingomonas sp. MMS24-JH45]